ncbi:MAG TPA: phosphatase PAP2 family protein [Gemmataceae bacterium]|nr:phosphatase PAP2 family protein [Gemmataceae bacterium]
MDAIRHLDWSVQSWFAHVRGQPVLDALMGDITALGSEWVLVLVVLFSAGLLLAAQRRRTAWFLLLAAFSGAVLARLLKDGIHRLRPPTYHAVAGWLTSPYSFPSGHSMMSAVIYLTLALILTAVVQRRRVQVYVISCALVLVGLIGLSRLYLGAHYLSDVVAGWLVGLLWALLCRWIEARWVLRAERRAAEGEIL